MAKGGSRGRTGHSAWLRFHRSGDLHDQGARRGAGRAAPRGPGLVGRAAPRFRRVRRRGVLGRHPARRHPGHLQDAGPLLVLGEHRADPVQGGHAPRVDRDAAVHPAQHRPARAHQAARHRLPRLHPAGHRQPAPGPHRPRPAHRRHGAGDRHRRLRRRRGVRAAAAGDQRTARRPAGGPGQDLLLVQPDDRLRRADLGRRRRRDDRGHRDPRLQPGHGRGAPRRAPGTISSPS